MYRRPALAEARGFQRTARRERGSKDTASVDLRVGWLIWEFQGKAASASNASSKLERHNDSLIAFAIVLLHQDLLKQFGDEGMRHGGEGQKGRRGEDEKTRRGEEEKGGNGHDKNILLA
jgi:hypothetical protein